MYNGVDLAESIMNPANCRFSTVKQSIKDNCNFAQLEPIYVYTDIKPNLVRDSYIRLLTSLYFLLDTGYHRFDYPFYKPVEQSFLESITFRVIIKSDENVLFEVSHISRLVILHFKKTSSGQ